MKCLVKKCTNTDEEGNGVFLMMNKGRGFHPAWICLPCFYAMHGNYKLGKNSQVVRNVQHRILKGE